MIPESLSAWQPLSLLQDDLVLFVVRVTLLLTFSLTAAALAKKASGQVHHFLWSMTFVALLLMAPLSISLPRWNLAVLPVEATVSPAATPLPHEPTNGSISLHRSSERSLPTPRAAVLPGDPESLGAGSAESSSPPWRLPILLWSLGALFAAGSISRSLLASRSLARRCETVTDPDWVRLVAETRKQLGIQREIPLRMSPLEISPMTGGWLRPEVVLPDVAMQWNDERRRIVLQHELVHVARHDVLRHLGVRLALAVYWFHPLAWLAARKAAAARERACDEGVMDLGAKASTYATHLMELADELPRDPKPALALPIIESTPLEERLVTILKNRHGAPNFLASLSIATALVLILFSVASAQPAPIPPEPSQAASPNRFAEAPEAPPAPEAPMAIAIAPPAPVAQAPSGAVAAVAAPAPVAVPTPVAASASAPVDSLAPAPIAPPAPSAPTAR